MSFAFAMLALALLVLLLAGATCLADVQEDLPGRLEEAEPIHIIIQRAVLTWEYWLYIIVYCTSAGSGQLVLTNLYQIADASGFAHSSEALLCLAAWT